MATATLISGPTRLDIDTDDAATVAAVFDLYRESLNIPNGATPTVNGEVVDLDTPVGDGDEVAFTKPTGVKG